VDSSKLRASACLFLHNFPDLSPIVDDIGAGAAIAGIVLPVHVHAPNLDAKSAGDEMSIGFMARYVHAEARLTKAADVA
jgi:hypothetical protein